MCPKSHMGNQKIFLTEQSENIRKQNLLKTAQAGKTSVPALISKVLGSYRSCPNNSKILKKLKIKKTVETFPKIQCIILEQSPIHSTTRFLINIISYVKDKRNQAMLSITSVTIKCSLNPAEISLKKMCQFNWLYTDQTNINIF